MTRASRTRRARIRRYRRARIRKFLFTVGPDRLSGGKINRRHLAQDVSIREIDVCCGQWPEAFDGLRIGHVSDFHLGELLPLDRALQIIDQLGEQNPDLIACTGDIVDLENTEAGPLLEAIGAIKPPMGSFLVLGNHDDLHDADGLVRMAVESGVGVLRNEAVEINRNGHHLVVAGIDWARSAVSCAREVDLACGAFAHLLLAHNPKAFLRAADLGVPLTLAGHTHGGQIAMRNRPNANLALVHRHSAGLFASNGSRLYVTTGVGAWFPLRVNCPAEVAILTVRREDEGTEGRRETKEGRGTRDEGRGRKRNRRTRRD